MQNPAPTDHPVHELIQQRFSPKAFLRRSVDPATLRSLLEAARWAPSSFNEQPWAFIVATSDRPEDFELLLACLAPGNQAWACQAPVLLLSVAKLTFDRNGRPNRHALHDIGLASAQLALEATDHGLAAHFMAGFDAERARQTYDIPAGFEPVAAVAVGYPAKPGARPGGTREGGFAPPRR
ncbi:MAG: nitroreductase family protein, partial [Proteobacteria bacterium]|nr:nitroreductase family protein [Pseudomonadota bacterium]